MNQREVEQFPELHSLTKHLNMDVKSNTFAGVGSRKATPRLMEFANRMSWYLIEISGYDMNTGNALGIDKAFLGRPQPYLKNSEGKVTKWSDYSFKPPEDKVNVFNTEDADDICRDIAREVHPAGSKLKGYVLDLHARNLKQVLGDDLATPVDFVICWTEDGCESHYTRTAATGGTGMAISYASILGIPVINIAKEGWRDKLQDLIKL